MKDTTGPVV